MKPTTKHQKYIVALSKRVPDISAAQRAWADTHHDKYYVVHRKTSYCLSCGDSFKEAIKSSEKVCTSCGENLKACDHYHGGFEEAFYYGIITTVEGVQVVRIALSRMILKKGRKPVFFHDEVMRHFITEDGRITTMSKSVQPMSIYYDKWNHWSDLEIRRNKYDNTRRYRITPYVWYGRNKVSDTLRRNGYTFALTLSDDIDQVKLMSLLYGNPRAETLLKDKQASLLMYLLDGGEKRIEQYWPSIRIAIRNEYNVSNGSTWIDYLHLLESFGKDLNNPVYVCPADLDAEHDRYVEKARQRRLREEYEAQKKQISEADQRYQQEKARFFDLLIKVGNLTITPLKSVQEFLQEADELKHCIFSNKYYEKKNSLILSARIDGKPVESIEVSLTELKVMQSRGLFNKPTDHHDKIVGAINKHINDIARCA